MWETRKDGGGGGRIFLKQTGAHQEAKDRQAEMDCQKRTALKVPRLADNKTPTIFYPSNIFSLYSKLARKQATHASSTRRTQFYS